MKVKCKKLDSTAVIPTYSREGDAGLDLVATSKQQPDLKDYIEYGTGLAFEIPKNHVGLIFPRSSVSNKQLILTNCVGVLDSGYQGEVKARFRKTTDVYFVDEYEVGDRIAQLVIVPCVSAQLEEVQEFSEITARGAGGFGSTGK